MKTDQKELSNLKVIEKKIDLKSSEPLKDLWNHLFSSLIHTQLEYWKEKRERMEKKFLKN